MALMLLPWAGVALATGGAGVALHLLVYAGWVSVVGFGVVSVALSTGSRSRAIAFSPALGILTISALTAFWLRLGLPLVWTAAFWLGLAAFGARAAWRDRGLLAAAPFAFGKTLIVISSLICFVYFLPGARRDAVTLSDGSFNWIYVDTQFFHSIAASLKDSDGPPTMPGTATAELEYHFGEYTQPAAISLFTGLDLGDAFARVSRGTSLWALVLSCYGLGLLLSAWATGGAFGGVMAVVGFFFYGSLSSLFSGEMNTTSAIPGVALFRLPGVAVVAQGGPFSHLILGHSIAHGMAALTAIIGLGLIYREERVAAAGRAAVWLVIPALVVPVDSPAALCSLAVVGILLFWDRLRELRSWWLLLLLAGVFAAAWWLMGYAHAPVAANASIRTTFIRQWWPLLVWFSAGLGFRILAFRWIKWPLRDPLSAMVAAVVGGFLTFSLAFSLYYGNERYGLEFLQCLLSLLAFACLPPGFWRAPVRSKLAAEWLAWSSRGLLLLVAAGVAMDVRARLRAAVPAGGESFGYGLPVALGLLILVYGLRVLFQRSERLAAVGSTGLLAVLAIGFFAWIPPWLNFGMGRMKMDVVLTPGEVRGLHRLRELAAPGIRFATNRHAIPTIPVWPEASYGYGALAERPVLLEGFRNGGESFLPEFETLRGDNDLLFATTDAHALRRMADRYRVSFLVARPGTDIALPRPLPAWLVAEPDCGDLKIYRINRPR